MLSYFIFISLLKYGLLEFCSSSTCGKNGYESNSILTYTKEKEKDWAEYLHQIYESVEEYTPCSKNSTCFSNVIIADLLPFKDKITKYDIQRANSLGTLYQVINNNLYKEGECMFPSRCKGIEHFILKIKDKLPDMEFVINSRDWPMSSKRDPLPIFSFSKTKDYADIAYPAWSFWEGGPAIKLYPSGIGRWDVLRKALTKEADIWTWDRKVNTAFFRGSRTSSERDNLIYLSRDDPNLVDAQYTKNQAWKSNHDTLDAPPSMEVSFEEHCKYKYLFNYRGVAASFRLRHLFLCKSLVFHVGSEWTEFFYPQLVPWVHYIPVNSDATQNEIKDLIYFAKENDKIASEIANRGYEFIKNHLRLKDITFYWKQLLLSYSELLSNKPKLRKGAILIK